MFAGKARKSARNEACFAYGVIEGCGLFMKSSTLTLYNHDTIVTYNNKSFYERKQAMSENVLEISDSNFETGVLQEPMPVLVDFWAPWCGPCRAIGPVVEELAGKFGNQLKFKKCNVDDNPVTPSKYGIKSIPTLIFFKNGKVFNQLVGAVAKSKLEDMIRSVLE